MRISKRSGQNRTDLANVEGSVRLHLPNCAFDIQEIHGELVITKIYGTHKDDDSMYILPKCGNQVAVK